MKRTIFLVALMFLACVFFWKSLEAREITLDKPKADITIIGNGVNLSGIVESKRLVVAENGAELL